MTEPVNEAGVIDYSRALHLDAEDLAEEGILDAYREIVPLLAEMGISARPVTSDLDISDGRYSVCFDGDRYEICPGGPPDDWDSQDDAWGRATWALFDIVNRQLAATDIRLYAIDGGNELSGILLTVVQAERARRALPRKTDWPYFPTSEPPWFGMFH
jgi:hypothetical protein